MALPPRQQICKAVVHAGHPEVRFALKGSPQVMNLMASVDNELDHTGNEVVEGCK